MCRVVVSAVLVLVQRALEHVEQGRARACVVTHLPHSVRRPLRACGSVRFGGSQQGWGVLLCTRSPCTPSAYFVVPLCRLLPVVCLPVPAARVEQVAHLIVPVFNTFEISADSHMVHIAVHRLVTDRTVQAHSSALVLTSS